MARLLFSAARRALPYTSKICFTRPMYRNRVSFQSACAIISWFCFFISVVTFAFLTDDSRPRGLETWTEHGFNCSSSLRPHVLAFLSSFNVFKAVFRLFLYVLNPLLCLVFNVQAFLTLVSYLSYLSLFTKCRYLSTFSISLERQSLYISLRRATFCMACTNHWDGHVGSPDLN